MTTACIIIFLFLLVLIIPVETAFKLKSREKPYGKIVLSLMFGLITYPIYPQKAKIAKDKPKAPKPKKGKRPKDRRRFLKLIGNTKLLSSIIHTIRSLLSSIKPDLEKFYLRFGIGDPADTGVVWGCLGPISGFLYSLNNKNFAIEPDFFEPAFDLEAEGRLSIVPFEIILIFLRFLISPTVLKAYWYDIREA